MSTSERQKVRARGTKRGRNRAAAAPRPEPDLSARHAQVQLGLLRRTGDFFKFFEVCGSRACRRARTCVGDTQACFDRFWPHVPEEAKVWMRTSLLAFARGATAEEASEIGNAEVVRFRAMQGAAGRRGEGA